MSRLLVLALLPLFACADSTPTFAPSETLTLTLEQRAGESARGWSIATGTLVPASDADLTISSFDCGARGRWVSLNTRGGLALCVDTPCNGTSLGVGGSDADLAIGDTIILEDNEVPLARLTLRGRTDTPFEWYEEVPLRPFEVQLALERAE